jgi:hypothetical protein
LFSTYLKKKTYLKIFNFSLSSIEGNACSNFLSLQQIGNDKLLRRGVMSDAYDIEPLTRSTPTKPIRRKNSENKDQKDNKKQQPPSNNEEDKKETSSTDEDQDLLHVDEFV